MTNNTGTAPLSVEVTRQEMHSRLIDMRGWGQSDGPYEVEGRVVDRKPHEFKSPNGFKVVPAGEPIHDMGVKLVFDSEMLVREVLTFTAAAPYGDCRSAGQTLQALKGLRIGAGWGAEVYPSDGAPDGDSGLADADPVSGRCGETNLARFLHRAQGQIGADVDDLPPGRTPCRRATLEPAQPGSHCPQQSAVPSWIEAVC